MVLDKVILYLPSLPWSPSPKQLAPETSAMGLWQSVKEYWAHAPSMCCTVVIVILVLDKVKLFAFFVTCSLLHKNNEHILCTEVIFCLKFTFFQSFPCSVNVLCHELLILCGSGPEIMYSSTRRFLKPRRKKLVHVFFQLSMLICLTNFELGQWAFNPVDRLQSWVSGCELGCNIVHVIVSCADFTCILELTTWPPANRIAWNVSPDGTLNRLEHTLPCSKFLRAHFAVRRRQDSSDSWAQEREGHAA